MSYSVFIGRKLNQETQTWLEENNISFSEQSLLEVEFLAPDLSFFNKTKNESKNWIITSNWAAKWLLNYNTEIGFQSTDVIYCISEKQLETLAGISVNVFVSEQKNAKSLAKLVRKKSDGKTTVYLNGNKSLNIFQNEVGQNIHIIETEVYRNIPVRQEIAGFFDAYLFFSPSGIESFIHSGNKIPDTALIFTIGQTTGHYAKSIFSNKVVESPIQKELEFVEFAVNQIEKYQRNRVKTEN